MGWYLLHWDVWFSFRNAFLNYPLFPFLFAFSVCYLYPRDAELGEVMGTATYSLG